MSQRLLTQLREIATSEYTFLNIYHNEEYTFEYYLNIVII